jgi:hypothetical protein
MSVPAAWDIANTLSRKVRNTPKAKPNQSGARDTKTHCSLSPERTDTAVEMTNSRFKKLSQLIPDRPHKSPRWIEKSETAIKSVVSESLDRRSELFRSVSWHSWDGNRGRHCQKSSAPQRRMRQTDSPVCPVNRRKAIDRRVLLIP